MNIQISIYTEIASGLIPYSIIPAFLISLMSGWFLKRISINIYWRSLVYSTIGTSIAMFLFSPETHGQGGRYNPLLIEDTLLAITENPMPALAVLTFIVFIYSYLFFLSVIKTNKFIFKIPVIIIGLIIIMVIPAIFRFG